MALPESPDHERLRRFVAARWVEQAPGEALGAFEAMDEGRMPTEWMFEMLARWMAVDEESASDWAYNTAAGRPRVLMTGAIDWLLGHGEPREAALASAERMLRRWARRDPAAAWEVASTDVLVGQMDVLLRGVAEVWLADDPRSAMDAAIADGAWQIMRRSWIVSSPASGRGRPRAKRGIGRSRYPPPRATTACWRRFTRRSPSSRRTRRMRLWRNLARGKGG